MKEEMRRMLEEAAGYILEKRGFDPGYEQQDWLRIAGRVGYE